MAEAKAHWLDEVLFAVGKQLEREGCKREAVAVFRLNAALHRPNSEPDAPLSTPGDVEVWFEAGGEGDASERPRLRVAQNNVHEFKKT